MVFILWAINWAVFIYFGGRWSFIFDILEQMGLAAVLKLLHEVLGSSPRMTKKRGPRMTKKEARG
jgi:hypothetical protein